jgi:hypothetical protein
MRSNELRTWAASSITGPVAAVPSLPLGSDAFLSPLNDALFARKPQRFGRSAIFVIVGMALVSTTMVATAWMLRASRESNTTAVVALLPVAPAAAAQLPLSAASSPVVALNPPAAAQDQVPAQIAALSTQQVASDAALAAENETTLAPEPRQRRAARRSAKRSANRHERAAKSVAHEPATRDDIVADLLQTKLQHGSPARRDAHHRPGQAAHATQDGQGRHNTAKRVDRDG